MMMFPKKKENHKEEQKPAEVEQPKEQLPKEELPAKEPQKQIDELNKQLDAIKKEKDDIFGKLQRVAADYDNYQKRSARQLTDSITYEKDKLIKALLPVLDNFEYIIANASCGAQDEVLLKGVKIIYDQLFGVLKIQGIEQIQSAGTKFDPAFHEAITHRAEEGKEDGIVLEELQKGYILKDRVIRASRVVVNKLPVALRQKPQQTLPAESQQQESEEEETRDTQ